MFLASLRVLLSKVPMGNDVTSLTTRGTILRVFHSITRFPPAVRAIAADRGTQSTVFGKSSVESRLRPVLTKGYTIFSRWVLGFPLSGRISLVWIRASKSFGLVLWSERFSHPYCRPGYRRLDLQNNSTDEIVVHPVISSDLGIVERGYYDSLHASGPLQFRNGDHVGSIATENSISTRIVRISGGVIRSALAFDRKALEAKVRNSSWDEPPYVPIHPEELPNLVSLANLASVHGLALEDSLRPKTAPSPVLTMDETGLLPSMLGVPLPRLQIWIVRCSDLLVAEMRVWMSTRSLKSSSPLLLAGFRTKPSYLIPLRLLIDQCGLLVSF